jgi:hypothetical protein
MFLRNAATHLQAHMMLRLRLPPSTTLNGIKDMGKRSRGKKKHFVCIKMKEM